MRLPASIPLARRALGRCSALDSQPLAQHFPALRNRVVRSRRLAHSLARPAAAQPQLRHAIDATSPACGSGGNSAASAGGRGKQSRSSVTLQQSQRRWAAAAASQPPLALVLDVDETLLRSAIKGVHMSRKLSKVDKCVHITIPSRDGGEDGYVECNLSYRPGLTEFLDWIRQRRDEGAIEGPWLFTTGATAYIDAVLQDMDPDGDLFGGRVLAKDVCTPTATPGYYLKDLTRVPASGGLQTTILVDNNPVSCIMHPDSCLLIHDWLGDGEPDAELSRVQHVVDAAIAQGVEGDYAASLSSATEGHIPFTRDLIALHEVLDQEPDPEATLAQTLRRRWAEVCAVKRQFLGPGPGCR